MDAVNDFRVNPMRFNKFDLNLLVALDALLTECNTTRAAEKVHITQSAMSNALSRLREYFDDELLVRVGQHMEMTPRAESLRDPVRDLLVRFDSSIAAKPEFDCTQSDREFTIFVSDYSTQTLIPRALARAAQQGSKVRFRLLPQIASPARALERGEADLLVIPRAYSSPDHPSEVIFSEDFVCVVWNESAAAKDGMTLESYTGAGHVVMVPHGSEHPAYENWMMQRYGFSRRVESTVYNFSSLPYLVIGTELVATVHTRIARALESSLPITLLPMPMQMPPLEQVAQWHKHRTSDPGIGWLLALMRSAGAAMNGPIAPALQGSP
jgi:LysR family transcriptional regulator, nod-box dependent transcriptional activator